MSKKAILAFSGGLDTSVAVKYLLQEYGLETITVTVDVGQQDDYRMHHIVKWLQNPKNLEH